MFHLLKDMGCYSIHENYSTTMTQKLCNVYVHDKYQMMFTIFSLTFYSLQTQF